MYASYSDDEEEDDFDHQNNRTNFSDMPDIYFKTNVKAPIGQKGQIKKSPRVFNANHACLFCGKMVCKPVEHMEQRHAGEERVRTLSTDQTERRTQLTLLRNHGDHVHNMMVIKAGRGELIMSRRPRGHGPFQASSFKPCPSCLSWVTNLARHRSHTDRCVAKATKMTKMTKREALLKSAVQMGRHWEHLRSCRMKFSPRCRMTTSATSSPTIDSSLRWEMPR